jgi:hypothetical protein
MALLSACLVALLPAHISLSVQSQSEAPFLFFVLACLLALVRRRILWSSVFLITATLIRYETLPLLLILPVYYIATQVKRRPEPFRPGMRLNLTLTLFCSTIILSIPLISIGINKFFGGFYFWQFPFEITNYVLEKTNLDSAARLFRTAILLFPQGVANLPSPKETTIGILGGFQTGADLVQMESVWTVLFLLLLCLALLGVIYGLKKNWRDFSLLIVPPIVFAIFLILAVIVGATKPKPMLTVPVQVFLTILAVIGIYSLNRREGIQRWAGTGAAAIIVVGFITLALTSRYAPPPEPLEVARVVKGLAGASTVEERLVRTAGLTGPAEQTDFLLRLTGAASEILKPFLRVENEQIAVVLEGKDVALDSYRNDMIQATADLSYAQFQRVPLAEWEARLEEQPAVMILAKDSLELSEAGVTLRIQQGLKARGYSLTFTDGPFEVWLYRKTKP